MENREYISVLFEEKDDAKNLGAKWNLDISLIENNNIKLSNKINKNDRQNICIKKLQTILPVDKDHKIERYYPNKKQEKSYPLRYDNLVFEKFNKMNADIELQNDYKKWKDGINYKTNRKIKSGGKIHTELKQKFIIKHGIYSVLFEDLSNINIYEYLEETKKINNDIDSENSKIKYYNISVDSIIKKIHELQKWNQFVEFEGIKYGIPYVYNNIHREHDCLGLIKENGYERCSCSSCENWGGCGKGGTEYYKCEKCNYKYSKSMNFSKNYKGK